MSRKMEVRPMSWCVNPIGEAIYSEMTTCVRIGDDAGGEFVEVEQDGHVDLGKIQINPNEWPALRSAINKAIKFCRSTEEQDALSKQ